MSFGFSGPDRFSTGVEALDRSLDGGIPPGSVVAYRAPPASQSELLLYELAAQRSTMYISTDRTEQMVADALERAAAPIEDPMIQYVAGDAPLENARRHFRNVVENMNLFLDPVDALELTERARYQNFLSELQNHMQNVESIAVLHCLRGETQPDLRDLTLHMADAVFDLRVTYEGAELEARLAVPKFRGGSAPNETLKLELSDRIRVDTSRDIA